MNNKMKDVYKFHVKIDADMKKCLKKVSLFKKTGSFSRLITRILHLFSPGLEHKHSLLKQKFSQYEFICDDKDIVRESVFIYLPEKQYRQLKSMHQDLNYYSMAQLLRMVLRVFLFLADELGDIVESKLVEFYLQKMTIRNQRKYAWKPIEELLHFIYQKPEESWFLTLYSRKFQPINFYLL